MVYTVGPRSTKLPVSGIVRLANIDDAPHVLELLGDSISKTFRVYCTNDIINLIENSVLAICQQDFNTTVVGFLAVRDYPLLPAIHPGAWEEYVWAKYKAPEMNSRNTLFIHLLCWSPSYGRDLVDTMLKSVFMHDAYLTHIALIKTVRSCPVLIPGQPRSEASFRRVTVIERGISGELLPALCVADRSEVCPRLRIRRAVLVDISLYISLTIQLKSHFSGLLVAATAAIRHPESDRIILVCEHSELAVGIMCLNTQINYESLEENFVLSPFGGLRQVVTGQKFAVPKVVESVCSLLPHYTDSAIKTKDKSRVTWVFEDDEFNSFRSSTRVNKTIEPADESELSMTEELPPKQQHILDLFDDEDEEFEFDIVNIHTDLLRVPEFIRYDAVKGGPADNIMKLINGGKESGQEKKPDRTKRSISTSGVTNFKVEPQRFQGAPNAFLLELYAMHPAYDERYSFDMLEAAFEMFPNRDYCIMSIPTNQTSFPLLEHFTLVTPYGFKMRYINESLYVAHVNSVRGKISVRPGEANDVKALKSILEYAPRKDNLIDLFKSTLSSHVLQAFTLLSQNQPMGVVVIGPLEDGTAIRTQYDLEPEPRKPGTDGTILAGVLSPVFEPHARWFMRELLRYSTYKTLFWICRLFSKGDASPGRNLMSLAGHMNPVHPRQSVPNISGSRDLDKIYKDLGCPFALWVLERPLTSLPKVYINSSIVVVGASRTGLSFLETLLMGPTSQYLTFSNVTLVSEHGLPTVSDCLKAADICVPRDGRYNDRYLKSVPFYYYLDVMSAVMVKIDRKRKCIHLKGCGTKYYDELVLACGQQFQHPDYLKESIGLVKEVAKGKPCDRMLLDNPKYKPETVPMPPDMPENVFLINSLFEANMCLRKLMRMIGDPKEYGEPLSKNNQVVVYGDCIEAYSCLAALLELGLQPELIAFVEPFPSNEEPAPMRVNCFNDETVDARVQSTVENMGIRVLRKCHLAAWHQIGSRVESLDFMAPLIAISLRCFALFYYGLRAINLHAFKAINESGLVYDGGLVVSPTFETNDPNIYGAGTCVRYSRRLYAGRSMHKDHYSEDIGEALARLFLHKLDPFMLGDPELSQTPSDLLPRYSSCGLGFKSTLSATNSLSRMSMSSQFRKWQPVMKFESPITQYAVFPGPLYYLKLRKPGKEIPMAIQQCLSRQGHTFTTDKNDNYFRLHLNMLHVVDGVTCLSHNPFSPEILQQLYGKHEAFFNKLYMRFQRQEIDDFYEFFTQPWMSALYQESFRDLVDDINEQDIGTIQELLKSKFAMYDAELDELQSTLLEAHNSISSISSIGNYSMEARKVGTFRSVIDRFVAKTAFEEASRTGMTLPSECGQSKQVRQEAANSWNKVGGERIVMAHVARYLEKYSVTNPHFALPKPENP
ncbi:cilia- and flagella-associated protein 61 [Spodoptera frugiperda]|uniref:Cilia- and flagella-associated protein 61 n=1 Tax=Spodoptera frugiperda TaxID=7108 RepID=A0A9R0EW78_SPOFR|nr:cilia- and flagella-associated protein 61 [Spodoptera frugiperda]